MIYQDIKQTLKNKLKDCDKEVLVDIIAEVCSMYIGARIFSGMSNANCIQQYANNLQTNSQEIDNFITQRINDNLKNNYGKD